MTSVELGGSRGQEHPGTVEPSGFTQKAIRARPSPLSSIGLPWHRSRIRPPIYRHPVNRMVFETATLGARIADRVTGYMGSWRFIVVQSVLVSLWLGANVILLARPFDPFPFILLNLAFSTQAAYAAPLILLAGNRASHRDRLTLEHAAAEGDLGDAQNERLLDGNIQILRQVAALEARILGLEQTILAAVRPTEGSDRAIGGGLDSASRTDEMTLTTQSIQGGSSVPEATTLRGD